jgi:hypothetical protein
MAQAVRTRSTGLVIFSLNVKDHGVPFKNGPLMDMCYDFVENIITLLESNLELLSDEFC